MTRNLQILRICIDMVEDKHKQQQILLIICICIDNVEDTYNK